MWEYLRRHESWIRAQLAEDHDAAGWEALRVTHERMIARMQHERLIHLLVTLFIALFGLLSVGFAAVTHQLFALALSLLLLGLVSAYLVHYFRLENGVQRWYHLADALAKKKDDS